MDTVYKFYWIINHTGFGIPGAQATIELTPHMINPEINGIDLVDPSKNTKLQWWIEVSKYNREEDCQTHYWSLDCGGDTAEQAIDRLYELVLEKYGEY